MQLPKTPSAPRSFNASHLLAIFPANIHVALSGGSEFTTTVDFLVYNDDEDQFSANRTFFCWERTKITNVSMLFENDWLRDFSGQNPYKGLGMDNSLEYGWFRMDGRDQESALLHATIAMPGATTESIGLPDDGQAGGAWIMAGGTSAAHIMIPGR